MSDLRPILNPDIQLKIAKQFSDDFRIFDYKIIEIMTLVLDSTSKKKLLLLKEIALEMGVKVTEMPKEDSLKVIGKNHLMDDIATSFKQLKKKKEGKIEFNNIEKLLNEK